MGERIQTNWLDLLLNRTPRRKIFVSYHHDNDQTFYNELSKMDFEYECVTDNSLDRLIDSDRPEYVIQRIRDECITGSSCTLVLCGRDTPWRKYLDWEIKATLDKNHGLLGIWLPTARRDVYGRIIVPDRLHYNVQSGYAQFVSWDGISLPTGPALLELWIEFANMRAAIFAQRVVNGHEVMNRNGTPPDGPATLSDYLSMLINQR
jgi:hypothetical protein